jgi:hypothetical protein
MRKYIFLIFLPFLCACSQPQSTVHSALADSLHAADSVVKPITKARIIIPGKSVGPMRIEGDADSLLTIMGKPDSIDGAMGASLMLWHVKYHKKMYETAIYAHRNMGAPDENINHIKAIWVSSTYYKTADYAGAGSELRDVKKLFKLCMPYPAIRLNSLLYTAITARASALKLIPPAGAMLCWFMPGAIARLLI